MISRKDQISFNSIILTAKSTKSMMRGYSKSRFPNLQGQIFDCPICSEVVKQPKQCSACGNLFCSDCIDNFKRNHHACKFGCIGNTINPISARVLINMYEELDIKCEKCNKVLKLGTLQAHEKNCGRSRCHYNDLCDGFEDQSIKCPLPVCSSRCELLYQIEHTYDQKKLFDLIKSFKPVSNMSSKSGQKISLQWESGKCCPNVKISNQGKAVYIKEEAYVFRSVLCEEGFMSGCHYWEIIADSRTQNELKIGVSKQKLFDYNTAFCDHKFGYAFYGLAQLRHGSNATGSNFGKRFKKSGALGIYLNMDRGEIHFSLNGEYLGRAFQDEGLKKGPIYPAVALLHCAGCSITEEMPIPEIFKDK